MISILGNVTTHGAVAIVQCKGWVMLGRYLDLDLSCAVPACLLSLIGITAPGPAAMFDVVKTNG